MAYFNGKKIASQVLSGTQLYEHALQCGNQATQGYECFTIISTSAEELTGAQRLDVLNVLACYYTGNQDDENATQIQCSISTDLAHRTTTFKVLDGSQVFEGNGGTYDYYQLETILDDAVTAIL